MDVIQGEHLATADGRRRPGAARNALIRACFGPLTQSSNRSIDPRPRGPMSDSNGRPLSSGVLRNRSKADLNSPTSW